MWERFGHAWGLQPGVCPLSLKLVRLQLSAVPVFIQSHTFLDPTFL